MGIAREVVVADVVAEVDAPEDVEDELPDATGLVGVTAPVEAEPVAVVVGVEDWVGLVLRDGEADTERDGEGLRVGVGFLIGACTDTTRGTASGT